jgi:hypothetical protein
VLQTAFRKRSKLSEHFFSTSTFIWNKSHIFSKTFVLKIVIIRVMQDKVSHFLKYSSISRWMTSYFRNFERRRNKDSLMHFLSNFICYWESLWIDFRTQFIEDLDYYYWSIWMLSFSCWQYYITTRTLFFNFIKTSLNII